MSGDIRQDTTYQRRSRMRGINIWTIVGVLLVIALVIFILTRL